LQWNRQLAVLDTAVGNTAAQRFYTHEGMRQVAWKFVLDAGAVAPANLEILDEAFQCRIARAPA
jgi:hypothetical protein